ncbi:MAG: hypothetical protein WC091_06230 [Sulfuricellaceae bacterium]
MVLSETGTVWAQTITKQIGDRQRLEAWLVLLKVYEAGKDWKLPPIQWEKKA